MNAKARAALDRGLVVPASPLALNSQRKLDERRQRALCRYYFTAGAGGIAIGVHMTQFAIRDPKYNLFKPVLQITKEELDRADKQRSEPLVRIAGITGKTDQAVKEAELVRELGYHAGLLSLAMWKDATEDQVVDHCKRIADIIPIVGFYLNPNIGGRVLPYSFWRRFAEIKNVVAIKVAPFDRYRTNDVVRAIAEAGRDDIALYTGNDDTIISDFITPFRFRVNGKMVERHIVGGLLGHWAVWTKRAVEHLALCHQAVKKGGSISRELMELTVAVTDCNSAFFDTANNFHGCIPGLHEVLRRQGLLEGIWCLNPGEGLGPGQMEQIDRVYRDYAELNDDAFVAEHRDEWLRG
jgi:hypothetical protein